MSSVCAMLFNSLFHVKILNRAIRFWFGHIACENVCYFAWTFPCARSFAWTMNIWQALRFDLLLFVVFATVLASLLLVTSEFLCGFLFSIRFSFSRSLALILFVALYFSMHCKIGWKFFRCCCDLIFIQFFRFAHCVCATFHIQSIDVILFNSCQTYSAQCTPKRAEIQPKTHKIINNDNPCGRPDKRLHFNCLFYVVDSTNKKYMNSFDMCVQLNEVKGGKRNILLLPWHSHYVYYIYKISFISQNWF